ncbi:MAG: alpha-glucan family phosphorylase, partial [Cyanobacteria bacterium NC_groundwater_1444_Ag_S-0.65um_54_12]|nr:alpha-glucan family phosphorylase [Cyanobacteria bacterium NC_groundwater_1444_Ag_S-0.65um_54_12]
HNLWWSWNPDAQALFVELDPEVWERVFHNPVKLLCAANQLALDAASANPAYLARMSRVLERFDAYMQPSTSWFEQQFPEHEDQTIAYFSAEFGLHEALPIYSGGLGILSGDHCKAASDLGIPLVGVGLLYNQGYFHQRITPEGTQEAIYERLHFAELPMAPARDPDGEMVCVGVDLPGRTVWAKVWEVKVGRTRIYLLDTDIAQNSQEDRGFSAKLYGGDHVMRVAQEIILGIGGVRALRALGIQPAAWHLNEGHSAFLGLERIRELVQDSGLSFDEAREVVSASSIFTTHTPVPAGNDAFSFELIEGVFAKYWPNLGIGRDEFLALARHDQTGSSPLFSMTILALKLSKQCNGVSLLHGKVSREIWRNVWPGVPVDEVPITAITNGIHTETWLAPEITTLLDRYLAADWRRRIADPDTWSPVEAIPDQELWEAHRASKQRMIVFLRERIRQQRVRNGEAPVKVRAANELLDPDALTIGFARRFATYKRATLIFRDAARLQKLLGDASRPVQLIFAGKAHPADAPGKEFIRNLVSLANEAGFRGRVIIIEDYDISVARQLVQGVDLWLNNPRRPLEASGTSGQKAAVNGVLNFSISDGWWPEAYNGRNGWVIGEECDYRDLEEQDEADAAALYALMEDEIVPLFYDRAGDGIPHGWIERLKNAIFTIAPSFSTQRMLQDYTRILYLNAIRNGQRFSENHFALAQRFSAWKGMMSRIWDHISIEAQPPREQRVMVGQGIDFLARLHLGALDPSNIKVEICHGPLYNGSLASYEIVPMELGPANAEGTYLFQGRIFPESGGNHGIGVRVVPWHPDLVNKHELGLVRWA